jgi:hypothetical protein
MVRISRSTSLPDRTVVQAKAVWVAADGVVNDEIARRSRAGSDAVRRWRQRFVERGPAGVGVIAKAVGGSHRCPRARLRRY